LDVSEGETGARFGRWFEEFRVGQVFRHATRKTITEYDNHLFCLLTMNHHPVHIDADFAAHSHFKRDLVVGTLVLSLCVGMSVADLSGKAIANLGYDDVAHRAPVFPGDTLFAESEITEVRQSLSNPMAGVVGARTSGLVVGRGEVLSFSRKFLVPTSASSVS
jgi:acyl dehydratase